MIEKDETSSEIYYFLGSSLSDWSSIESSLSFVFLQAMRTNNILSASSVFWSIQNTHGKLSLVNAALSPLFERGALDQEIEGEWKDLKKELKKLARARAKLAHGTVMGFPKPIGDKQAHVYRLLPYAYSNLHNLKFDSASVEAGMKASDIRAIGNKFRDLNEKITKFALLISRALNNTTTSKD